MSYGSKTLTSNHHRRRVVLERDLREKETAARKAQEDEDIARKLLQDHNNLLVLRRYKNGTATLVKPYGSLADEYSLAKNTSRRAAAELRRQVWCPTMRLDALRRAYDLAQR